MGRKTSWNSRKHDWTKNIIF